MVSSLEREPVGQASFPAEDVESPSFRERYRGLIEKSVSTILREQHPVTGLFPAATRERHVREHHYDDAWVRDSSAVAIALLNLDSEDLAIDAKVRETAVKAGVNFINGMLSLCASEPWRNAFDQESIPAVDGSGRIHRKLAKEAPPIHFKTDGNQCAWPSQNQPDSWGELLISIGLSLKKGLITFDQKQRETIDSITKYLLNIKVPDLEQFAMWEWAQGAASLSSVAIVAKGLEMIMPYSSSDISGRINKEVDRSRKLIEATYPVDYTVCYGHGSRTDLATFVAHGFGALEGFSFDKLLEEAEMELGNGQFPGKKRFIGDHYYRVDGEEAIWPLGGLLEAKILLERSADSFKSGDFDRGVKSRAKGLACLDKIIDLQKKHGYVPELLEQRNGKLVPNNNHLLWNEALLIQVCAGAEIAENLNPTKLN